MHVSYGCEPSLLLTQEYKLTAIVNRVMRLHMQYRTGISRPVAYRGGGFGGV